MFESIVILIVGLSVGMLLGRRLESVRWQAAGAGEAPGKPAVDAMSESEDGDPAASGGEGVLYSYADQLEPIYERSAFPTDILLHPLFEEGVAAVQDAERDSDRLVTYAAGGNHVLACLALETLARRPRDPSLSQPLVDLVPTVAPWVAFFVFRALATHCPLPIAAAVLTRIQDHWTAPVPLRILREFLQARRKAGETIAWGDHLEQLNGESAAEVESVLKALGGDAPEGLLDALHEWQRTRVDVDFLRGLGLVWDRHTEKEWIAHPELSDHIDYIERSLGETRPRSMLLVGENGVGKSALAGMLGKRLQEQGWVIFQAGATELLAGQTYIGQLEDRIQTLLRQIGGGRKVLWLIPAFHDLTWAGSHQYSPTSIFDMVYPALEKGELVVLGETHPAAYERLLQVKPAIRMAMEAVRLNPLDEEKTLALAQQWSGRHLAIRDETLREAWELTRQYMSDKAAPGNLLSFLKITRKRILSAAPDGESDATVPIGPDDLLLTLSQLSGLPVSILDDRQVLDIDELRGFFSRRVMGQAEAIDCLVERVAMIKAGLTDPTRPSGVFLFAGPTGTGKTEIAKTLAKYLFGSPQRMIRLDMSEFQTPEAIGRILGEPDRTDRHESLATQIRKQPFSVVLLDEFEKSAPNIWDLFLQVFDDGRLTDRRGNVADFRHCIIVMTSNLGAVIPSGASIGFTGDGNDFAPGGVARAIDRTFRREFINRIDRVVVFQPLSRSIMRDILRKELHDTLQRRGLRVRAWAVEWHDSAIEFLLDKGFTPDLGARPLKRAIERYVLSPLAMSIVAHQFPEGDQFLMVRGAGRRIEVEFIDPDLPDGPPPEPPAAGELTISALALDPRGGPAEVRFLETELARLGDILTGESWNARKSGALAETGREGFWESPERFAVLGMAEYLDRIEAGMNTAMRLLERLQRGRDRQQYSPRLVQQLAHQLYLIEAACRGVAEEQPPDAFLQVAAVHGGGDIDVRSDAFAAQIAAMYRGWAEKRRMRLADLPVPGNPGGGPFTVRMAISGYAAYAILSAEDGLHVLEIPAAGKSFQRCRVHVRVAPQPPVPPEGEDGGLAAQAERAFAAQDDGGRVTIVRRYREAPSPLVRDSVKGWRTGRLEQVLDGNFDLIL